MENENTEQDEVVDQQSDAAQQGVEQEAQPKEQETQPDVETTPEQNVDELAIKYKRTKRQLRRERQAVAELRDKVEDLSRKFEGVSQNETKAGLLKKAKERLNLDDENSEKFVEFLDEYTNTKIKPTQNQPNDPNLTPRAAQFKQKVQNFMGTLDQEEQDEISPFMYDALKGEMEEYHRLGIDPEDVYEESMSRFYNKALKLKSQADVSKKETAIKNKINNKNLAGSESSNTNLRPNPNGNVVNQESYNANRNNPQWIAKNRDAILAAARKGLISSR